MEVLAQPNKDTKLPSINYPNKIAAIKLNPTDAILNEFYIDEDGFLSHSN